MATSTKACYDCKREIEATHSQPLDSLQVIDRPARIIMHGGSTMIVISRKKNESVVINDDITVTVIEIRGDKVRLGIEGPRDATIHRREVYEAIMAQSQARTSLAPAPPTIVTLTESQVALLERVRSSIGLSGEPEPTLEQTLGMLFDAVEEAEELLTALVVDGVRVFRTP
jgi:carbon storage regulator